MTAKATTPQFATKITMDVFVGRTPPPAGLYGPDDYIPNKTMFVAQSFKHDDGSTSGGCDNNMSSGIDAGVNWTNPIKTGKTVSQAFFLIIQDWTVAYGRTVLLDAGSKNNGEFLYHTADNYQVPLLG